MYTNLLMLMWMLLNLLMREICIINYKYIPCPPHPLNKSLSVFQDVSANTQFNYPDQYIIITSIYCNIIRRWYQINTYNMIVPSFKYFSPQFRGLNVILFLKVILCCKYYFPFRLYKYINGGKKEESSPLVPPSFRIWEGNMINTSVSSIGAIVALGLTFLKTGLSYYQY